MASVIAQLVFNKCKWHQCQARRQEKIRKRGKKARKKENDKFSGKQKSKEYSSKR